jgi:hypothetical protein
MTPLDILICATAVWHAVEVWHHGSIFADWRARLELGSGFFSSLLLCPFCLSMHTALIVTGWYLTAQYLTGTVWYRLPVYALAVCRLANLANDMTHWSCRTPRQGGYVSDE